MSAKVPRPRKKAVVEGEFSGELEGPRDPMRDKIFMAKVEVESWQRELYDQALESARGRSPVLTMATWMRNAMNEAARTELELEGCPCCQAGMH